MSPSRENDEGRDSMELIDVNCFNSFPTFLYRFPLCFQHRAQWHTSNSTWDRLMHAAKSINSIGSRP